jgi:hypothetical protein
MALSNGPNLRTAIRSFSVIAGSFGIYSAAGALLYSTVRHYFAKRNSGAQ